MYSSNGQDTEGLGVLGGNGLKSNTVRRNSPPSETQANYNSEALSSWPAVWNLPDGRAFAGWTQDEQPSCNLSMRYTNLWPATTKGHDSEVECTWMLFASYTLLAFLVNYGVIFSTELGYTQSKPEHSVVVSTTWRHSRLENKDSTKTTLCYSTSFNGYFTMPRCFVNMQLKLLTYLQKRCVFWNICRDIT